MFYISGLCSKTKELLKKDSVDISEKETSPEISLSSSIACCIISASH